MHQSQNLIRLREQAIEELAIDNYRSCNNQSSMFCYPLARTSFRLVNRNLASNPGYDWVADGYTNRLFK